MRRRYFTGNAEAELRDVLTTNIQVSSDGGNCRPEPNRQPRQGELREGGQSGKLRRKTTCVMLVLVSVAGRR